MCQRVITFSLGPLLTKNEAEFIRLQVVLPDKMICWVSCLNLTSVFKVLISKMYVFYNKERLDTAFKKDQGSVIFGYHSA